MNKMKCSMSMSSLDSPPKVLRTPDGPKKSLNTSRLCNSLSSKKPRRTLEKKMYRRSWGSTEEMSHEELWKACVQSVQGITDLTDDEQSLTPVKDFLEDYTQVCEWLNSVQAERSRFADVLILSKLSSELQQRRDIRVEMNARGKILVQSIPKLKEEFQWRMKHMNSQWDALEKILLCQSSGFTNTSVPTIDGTEGCDIEWVRKWLREMENELQPLAFNIQWTSAKLEEELSRHKALQTEIEAKSPSVHGALRQSNIQGRTVTSSSSGPAASKKRVEILERRWIQLRLRVLEWVEHLSRIKQKEAYKQKQGRGADTCSKTPRWELSDEETQEPLTKYPRLLGYQLVPGSLENKLVKTVTEPSEDQEDGFPVGAQALEPAVHEGEDWVMGQSHDTETVYQSGSPVPNSVIEFSFDGTSGSVGLKRKLSPPSSSPPRTFLQHPIAAESPQVVPTMNISTYYFKHSDTEPEMSVNRRHKTGSPVAGILPTVQAQPFPQTLCQKVLDFGQEPKAGDWLRSCSPVSLDLGFDLDEFYPEEDEERMDSEEHTLPLQNLNEIEELVQKAELLVKNSVGLSQRARALEFWDEAGSEGTSSKTASFAEYSQRKAFVTSTPNAPTSSAKKQPKSKKCSNSSAFAEGSPSVTLTKVRPVLGSCSCPTPLDGAVGGTCRCELFGESDIGLTPSASASSEKKHSRIRQWVRAHNQPVSELIGDQKNTSSCDASAESASESESELSESAEEPLLSSDDPTTICASTTQISSQYLAEPGNRQEGFYRKGGSSSSVNYHQRSPTASTSGGPVVWRLKKRTTLGKQRPKSFTENLCAHASSGFGQALSSIVNLGEKKQPSFVSDPALNLLGNNSGSWSSSGGGSPGQSNTDVLKEKKKSKFRRRLVRHKRRSSIDYDEDEQGGVGYVRSTSLFAGGFHDMESQLEEIESTIPESPLKSPTLLRLHSDNTSVNTEELNTNDQDWDSYQEKYLSEPYSEEPYDCQKLLAFGEDYDQVLDRADSESSSMLSGFEPNSRKRRPLSLVNRGEMESDSDREEFNHFLTQSVSQLRFIDVVFRKQLLHSVDLNPEAPEFAEMEATCEENINSLKLILGNVEKPDALPFGIDVKSIQDVLEKWDLLKEKITQAAKLQQIQEEMELLKHNFDSVQQQLGDVDPFDSRDLSSLQYKIEQIQSMLGDLGRRKKKLQNLNEASLGTQVFLKETSAVSGLKKQLQDLYALYEENFELGTYLLEKMKYLEEAWSSFENERNEFEKSMTASGLIPKAKSEFSSALSTDSGHGTDFSHDSSISDSDMDFQERTQKLVALRKRASDLKSFLPPGSPVLDVIDTKINEAQRDFETMKKIGTAPLNLRIIYPKKRSPVSSRKSSLRSPPRGQTLKGNISLTRPRSQSISTAQTKKEPSRHWRALRFSLTFQFCILGLFAVAWFFQPRCCENMNTFCFSLVPQLTHERIPRI